MFLTYCAYKLKWGSLSLNIVPGALSPKAQNVQKMAEMGHYMDVSVQPARKVSEESTGHNRSYKFMKRNLHHGFPQICLTEVMPGEEMEEQLLSGKARVIRHDRFCSSDTSFDSSLSSDLEVGWE